VNHAFIYVGEGAAKIIEATYSKGVVEDVNPYSKVRWSTGILLTDKQRADIIKAARFTIGRPYNVLDILALGADAWGWRWPSQWKRLNDNTRFICSQDVAYAYLSGGVVLVDGKNSSQVTPGDLLCVVDGL
jgi:hypothetical protein